MHRNSFTKCRVYQSAGTSQHLPRVLLLSVRHIGTLMTCRATWKNWLQLSGFCCVAQRPNLPLIPAVGSNCFWSACRKASYADVWEPEVIQCREDLASATSFTLVYLDLQFWFSFLSVLSVHLSWILYWITAWDDSEISALFPFNRSPTEIVKSLLISVLQQADVQIRFSVSLVTQWSHFCHPWEDWWKL